MLPEIIPAYPGLDRSCVPLSFGQRRLWFLDRLAPGGTEYVISRCFWVTGPLDLTVLHSAFVALADRHEVLRSRFGLDRSGSPIQAVHPKGSVDFEVTDLTSGTTGVEPQVGLEWARKELSRPFMLDAEPLMRVRVACLGQVRHLVVVAVHHAIADGWSMGVLARDLSELYAAGTAHRVATLPELPVQYPDFAVWQNETLQRRDQRGQGSRGTELDRQLNFWRARLKGLEPLELPTDRPRGPVRSTAGGELERELDQELAAGVRRLARDAGVTVFVVLVSMFQVLLSRYCGRTDVAVGTPVAGRSLLELEDLIGCFVNTLVLRTQVTPELRVSELLRRVSDDVLDSFECQEVPFEWLVEELSPDRNLSGTPLFQVMFVQETTDDLCLLPGLDVQEVRPGPPVAKFDLTVTVRDLGADSGIGVRLEYARDLFEPSTMSRLAAHYQQLLTEAVAAADTPVGRLAMLTPAEDAELQSLATARIPSAAATAGSAQSADDPHSVVTLFEQRAGEIPEAPAVSCGGRWLTYRELDQKANQLAWHLRSLGAGPEVPIGVCLPRGVDLLVAILGILKSGSAYVPLDDDLPGQRLRFMLDDTTARLIVTESATLARLPAGGWAPVLLDTHADQIALRPVSRPRTHRSNGLADLAYVLYTSGSTGAPKGVQITVGNLASLIAAMADLFPMAAGDKFLALTAIVFDISNLELFLPLVSGAQVVLSESHQMHDMAGLGELLADPCTKYVQATPSLWRMLPPGTDLSRLNVLVGGEALPRDLARDLAGRARTVTNLYGPTETTIWSTAHLVGQELGADNGTVPIGRPIANTDVHVITPSGHPAPIGVPGELWIGGAGVARGYLNRPELTAEKFVPHPRDPGRKAYRTGDIVRWTVQGTLDYLGRNDNQAKVRGHRIELDEISHALRSHPAVTVAVSIVQDSAVHSYYVASAPVTPTELRDHLRLLLPGYAVPATYTPIDHLPLTPTGKTDYAGLPRPGAAGSAPGSTTTTVDESPEPANELEEFVRELWERVLGPSRPIGVDDNFFTLGGHSLKAAQLANHLETETGYAVSLRQIFQNPTVRELSLELIRMTESDH
ncbi:amino acid adenylation domain-containing protein [Kribbella sp. NPDC020789]